MVEVVEFQKIILDVIGEHIVVIDRGGGIVYVNQAWREFAKNNGCLINGDCKGVNYIEICDKAAARGDEDAAKAEEGIKKVINNKQSSFYFEYPCHSPDKKRWFMMRVTPFVLQGASYFVILHQNITKRKLIEEKMLELSRTDGLTNTFNRRHFDEFLKDEWRRCARLNMPITLAIIDLDYFKLLNDTYGHQAGDDCLRSIGAVLMSFANRPGDICARYGGEEFSMVFGNTEFEQSLNIINKVLNAIRNLKIPNINSPVIPIVTASIGMMTMHPDGKTNVETLIKYADMLLYSAKQRGRNQIVSNCDK